MFERIDRFMTIVGREVVAAVIEGFASYAACMCVPLDDQASAARAPRPRNQR